ncbi:MAG TPA: response regulator [Propionibacteriaceae bacterium]|nr:response regulator [Propionibacteriaceae bacterium]
MAPEAQARIFEGFSQAETSTASRFGGTGLGLTISRELVRLMGSDLELESALGEGSTFWFDAEFPTSRAGRRPGLPGVGDAVPGETRRLDGIRILLAEDNEINIDIEAELLRREGALVWLARDGAAAVERARSGQEFDVVLMDVQMPVLDGLEATRRIRRHPELAGLPVIALTAFSSSAERDRCLAAGMNDYLHKPFDVNELTATIRHWVGVADAPREQMPAATVPGDRYFDGDAALARLGGDRAFYARALGRFLRQLPDAVADVVGALRGDEPASAAPLAHALTGSAATVGAVGVAGAASAIEAAAREWKPGADVEALARNLEAMVTETTRAASGWL